MMMKVELEFIILLQLSEKTEKPTLYCCSVSESSNLGYYCIIESLYSMSVVYFSMSVVNVHQCIIHEIQNNH